MIIFKNPCSKILILSGFLKFYFRYLYFVLKILFFFFFYYKMYIMV